MTGGGSALQLVLSGDPGLFAIVRLSLLVSLSAVLLAAADRGAGRRTARAHALPRPRGRRRHSQCADGLAAGRRRPCGLSPAVAIGAARRMGPAVHAAGHGHRADRAGRADHRRADAADDRRPVGGISGRAHGDEYRPAAPRVAR